MLANKGDWVEIKSVILNATERDQKVPEDTKKVPLISYIQGFLEENSNIGDEVSITSIIGRRHVGTLVDSDPQFTHNFGKPIKELLTIGQELKTLLHLKEGSDSFNE